MAKHDFKEPEEPKEPEVQVKASEEKVVKVEPTPAKKKKVIQKKFAKYAKGK